MTNLQSKKSDMKGSPSKAFSGTRVKWGSHSSGGVCSGQRALCKAET